MQNSFISVRPLFLTLRYLRDSPVYAWDFQAEES